MAKDAYYFSHDSNAKDDPKCVMLIEQLGLEGYGIYWVLVETLRDQPNYKYPVVLIPALARRYNTTAEKMRTVVNSYGLFTVDNEEFFSLSLMQRMSKMNEIKAKRSIAGKKSAEKRLLLAACSTNDEQMLNNCLTNDEQRKEKKGKESKYIFSSEHATLAGQLKDQILFNNRNAKIPEKLDSWSNTIRLMIERDNRTVDQISKVINWCQQDQFWKSNILSADSLRKQFDKLVMKMPVEGPKNDYSNVKL